MKIKILVLVWMFFSFSAIYAQENTIVVANENLIVENIPEIPKELSLQVTKYSKSRGVTLTAIHPTKNNIIVSTRIGSTALLYGVSEPMAKYSQITFSKEPISKASYEPINGDYLVHSKDNGGNEFTQLYKLDLLSQQATLLTDGGRSQNGGINWRSDGKGFFYTSTKRNGSDRDIYYLDPNEPQSEQLILEVKGGGWSIQDVADDNKKLLIGEYISANESHIWLLDFST